MVHARRGNVEMAREMARGALTMIESMEGSEYAIQVRALCCEILALSASSTKTGERSEDRSRYDAAATYVDHIAGYIQNETWEATFRARQPVRFVLERCHHVSDSP